MRTCIASVLTALLLYHPHARAEALRCPAPHGLPGYRALLLRLSGVNFEWSKDYPLLIGSLRHQKSFLWDLFFCFGWASGWFCPDVSGR
jgi:hypothetical protein